MTEMHPGKSPAHMLVADDRQGFEELAGCVVRLRKAFPGKRAVNAYGEVVVLRISADIRFRIPAPLRDRGLWISRRNRRHEADNNDF